MVIEILCREGCDALEHAKAVVRRALDSLGIRQPIDVVKLRNHKSGGKYAGLTGPIIKVNGERILSPSPGLPDSEILRYKIARAAGLRTVLFIGKNNAVRSQMAEGIVNDRFKGTWAAFSAGLMPVDIPMDVIKVMRERSVDISAKRAKHLDLFKDLSFDRIVMLCEDASKGSPRLPEYAERECLFFRDTLSSNGALDGALFSMRSTFRGLRDDIEEKVVKYLDGINDSRAH